MFNMDLISFDPRNEKSAIRQQSINDNQYLYVNYCDFDIFLNVVMNVAPAKKRWMLQLAYVGM